MVTLRRPPSGTRPGPVLEPYQVLERPMITEKATFAAERYNSYTFQVNPLATKTQIKAAVEELFNVRVERVNTQLREGKKRRFRQGVGKLPNWKKAIVTLNEEDKIDFF